MVLFSEATPLWMQLWAVFTAGSVIGWLLEMLYRSGKQRRAVNPGLLHGPFVPLYGLGLLIVLGGYRLTDEYGFLGTALLMTLAVTFVEYVAGMLLERLVGTRLWDYRDRPLNLHGRICFQFSLYWFVLIGVVLIALDSLAVFASAIQLDLSSRDWRTAALSVMGYFLLDMLFSTLSLVQLRAALRYVRMQRAQFMQAHPAAARAARTARKMQGMPQRVQQRLQRRLERRIQRRTRRLVHWTRRFPALGRELMRVRRRQGLLQLNTVDIIPDEIRLSRRLRRRRAQVLERAEHYAREQGIKLSGEHRDMLRMLASLGMISPVRAGRVVLAAIDPDDPDRGMRQLRLYERLLVNLVRTRVLS